MLFSTIFLPKLNTENQNKFPLLILHGFLGMSDNWKTLATQYAENGFEVHTIDLRNHGRSFHSALFNYQEMEQDLLDYCLAKKITKFNLLGHSMGGKLAMFFAMNHAFFINKLIIADIAPKYYAPHHDEILSGLQSVDFSVQPTRAEVESTLINFIPDFGTRQFLLKNLYWQTPGQLAFRFNLQAFLDNKSTVGEALPEDAVYLNTVLFIRGGNSKYIIDADFMLIKKHFPNANIETIANVGHWLHAENPKVFLEKTLHYLKQ